jgi:hypothetical protein
MTKSKTSLPFTIPVQIPTCWTPEQALAVFEMVDDLRHAIWRCYELELLIEYRKQRKQAADCAEQDFDDLPF